MRSRWSPTFAGTHGKTRIGSLSDSRLMVTLGVDLASQPERTGTCLIRWDLRSARVETLSLGATDAELHELFGRADKIGIDAPFGWPAPFTRAIANYSTSMVWPSVDVPQLRFRRTDEVAKQRMGRWPLSVSSDLIAVPAMRAVRLLAETAATGQAIDRSGGGRFVEVYPAAALSVWEFPSRGYKRAKGAAVRAQLVRDLAEQTTDWLTLSTEDWARCRASDDVLDALVAALVARAAAIGCCEPIPPRRSRAGHGGGMDRTTAVRKPRATRVTPPCRGRPVFAPEPELATDAEPAPTGCVREVRPVPMFVRLHQSRESPWWRYPLCR